LSTYCTNIVWRKLDVAGTEKVLLLAVADIANDEGENIHPSNEYLEWMTGVPVRTIQYYKAKWKKIGGLVPVENEHGGAGNFVRYKLNLGAFPIKAGWRTAGEKKGAIVTPFVSPEGCKEKDVKGARSDKKGAMDGSEGCNSAYRNKEEPLAEPQHRTVRENQAPATDYEPEEWVHKIKAAHPRLTRPIDTERHIVEQVGRLTNKMGNMRNAAQYLLMRTEIFAKLTADWPPGERRFIPGSCDWFEGARFEENENDWKWHGVANGNGSTSKTGTAGRNTRNLAAIVSVAMGDRVRGDHVPDSGSVPHGTNGRSSRQAGSLPDPEILAREPK